MLLGSKLNANTILFDSKNIKVEDEGDMVYATRGTATIPSENLQIEGDKFVYDKKNSELIIFDDVKYFDKVNNIYIKTQKLIYNQTQNIVLTKSDTYIKVEDTYEINSSDVFYERNFNKIYSKRFTTINDLKKNKFLFNSGLILDTIKEIVTSKELILTDKDLNNYFFENSKINLKINEIIAKDIVVDFEDSFFGNENNNPFY